MPRTSRAAANADLQTGALPGKAIDEWLAGEPRRTSDLSGDRERFSAFWHEAGQLIDTLPPKSARDPAHKRRRRRLSTGVRVKRASFFCARMPPRFTARSPIE